MNATFNPPNTFILRCADCGESWYRRGPTLPKQCPRCGDRHWNKPRIAHPPGSNANPVAGEHTDAARKAGR